MNGIEGLPLSERALSLGVMMDEQLPFRRNRIACALRMVQVTPKAIIPTEGDPSVFTRAWLERPAAWEFTESNVSLISDLVSLDSSSGISVGSKLEAVFDPRLRKTEVLHMQGLGIDEQRDRIDVLGSYVHAIAGLQRDNDLRSIVSEYHL